MILQQVPQPQVALVDILRACTSGVACTNLKSLQDFLKGGALLCISVPALTHQLLELVRHVLRNVWPASH